MNKRLILRADGDQQIGFGHVYRLLALAQMLIEDFYITFAITNPTEFISKSIIAVCDSLYVISSVGKDNCLDIAELVEKDDVIILDGVKFDLNYQRLLKERACKVVLIEDEPSEDYACDVVINHIVGADQYFYVNKKQNIKYYLGPKYAIVRKDFLKVSSCGLQEDRKMFICLGNSKTEFEVTLILHCLLQIIRAADIQVLTSKANADVLSQKFPSLTFFYNLEASEVVKLIAKSEVCFTTPSTISYEIFCLGKPLVTGSLNSTQAKISDIYNKCSLASNVGYWQELTYEKLISSISEAINYKENQKVVFDLKSPKRLNQIISSLC